VRRIIAWLLTAIAVVALLIMVVAVYIIVQRRFGLVFALAAVGLVLSIFVPAGGAVRKARFWRWLAED
jgi:peptidoglycan/LPS O-acetylase OafA/YrhL